MCIEGFIALIVEHVCCAMNSACLESYYLQILKKTNDLSKDKCCVCVLEKVKDLMKGD